MSYFQEQKLIAFGAIIGVAFTFIGFYMTKPEAPVSPQSVSSKSNFEVVDTYKGCDVVRWGNGFADYKYFLHCSK